MLGLGNGVWLCHFDGGGLRKYSLCLCIVFGGFDFVKLSMCHPSHHRAVCGSVAAAAGELR